MAKKRDSDKALDVIGKTLRTKEIIDKEFNAAMVKESVGLLENIAEEEKTVCPTISFVAPGKDIGFNLLANLNLGKAYKIINPEDEELPDGEISVNAKRVRYPKGDNQALEENWLDYILDKIQIAKNSIVIVENIFTRRTTGNYKEVLPYQEQLAFIYKKLTRQFNINNKIVAMVRGVSELDIIKNGGPDLMKKLASMLNMKDKLCNAGTMIEINIKQAEGYNKPKIIRIMGLNQNTNAREGVFRIMRKSAASSRGCDVYYNYTAKQNGMFATVTKSVQNNNIIEKPSWYICAGPMFERDKFNLNRPSLAAYEVSKFWYKIGFENKVKDGEIVNNVRVDFQDYAYPYSDKVDYSSFVSSIISDELTTSLKNCQSESNLLIDQTIECLTQNTRQGLNKYYQKIKNAKKKIQNQASYDKTNCKSSKEQKQNSQLIKQNLEKEMGE